MESENKPVIENQISICYKPEEFWQLIRQIIREEIERTSAANSTIEYKVPGLTYKPIYKMNEVCKLFEVTKPTIYDWIRHGKLTPFKVRSRVYFLWRDLESLINGKRLS